MLEVLRSKERGRTKIDWLDSYHSFSFGEYYDPKNMGFGPLRVINDDLIQAGAGFPTHPHRDMEIVTIVTQGAVAHRDSSGGEGIIRVGEVQKMSAGKGIFHSEFNASDKEILKLYQIWIMPNQNGLKPGYEDIRYDVAEKKNKLLLAASNNHDDGVIFLNQDAKIYLADLEAGTSVSYQTDKSRGVYVHVTEGSVEIEGTKLSSGDAIKLTEVESVEIKASEDSGILLFDVVMNF
ncbi:MAG: quercetin 2,3-dioxygenase [Stygiobacter sp. RIFOXYC12_FULL_38_8]|nr:MAG: quercetin 2,3-dioxygenase [Stygiobacter sp. RIFOXYA12_FULL_38_9]OGV08594.1 MAG: quercetin 2,3-dioxygenase [Stygiobacter sp. RIFOXYB2_FULL_37_11]OGV11821.1 MAG: quercetin 2,3-dioxygenase [Stygiobacter sp. RIFOXYA2_FULL_38_8]OGV12519.1 MAG: quercetin 2,3-dioxygenase [Stygiobacter sp. RIFOXYC2_FULL_38_25]OGV24149.1 MAG: quercetin 2,3-dioxygenase [Stygiobacter sp. RIFOXYC12_FULL_38_8]OGV78784.1 MAG: quercetin 2,3-dioxygenase [Stygiobacter sp. GWF2_38_21]RJQ57325.1 MAG: pirin family protei